MHAPPRPSPSTPGAWLQVLRILSLHVLPWFYDAQELAARDGDSLDTLDSDAQLEVSVNEEPPDDVDLPVLITFSSGGSDASVVYAGIEGCDRRSQVRRLQVARRSHHVSVAYVGSYDQLRALHKYGELGSEHTSSTGHACKHSSVLCDVLCGAYATRRMQAAAGVGAIGLCCTAPQAVRLAAAQLCSKPCACSHCGVSSQSVMTPAMRP